MSSLDLISRCFFLYLSIRRDKFIDIKMTQDFSTATVVALKSMCKSRGLKGYSKLRKLELVSLLQPATKPKPELKLKPVVSAQDSMSSISIPIRGDHLVIEMTPDSFVNMTSLSKDLDKNFRD